MKKSWKALVLSALVLPGLGQISQHRFRVGVPLIVGSLVAMVSLVVRSVQLALDLLEQLELQGAALGVDDISRAAGHTVSAAGGPVIQLALWGFMLCWLIGVVDALMALRDRPGNSREN